MFRRGFYGAGNCFVNGYGFMNSGLGILAMAVLVVLTVILIMHFVRKSSYKQTNNIVLEELKMRFVKGEITEEEYIKRKNILD